MLKLENGTNSFYQWDLDQRLIVTEINGPASVHFWQQGQDAVLEVDPYEEDGKTMADVPNILLQKASPITMYIYRKDIGAYTSYKRVFQVFERERPAGYVYTETETRSWEYLGNRIKVLEDIVPPAPTANDKYYIVRVNKDGNGLEYVNIASDMYIQTWVRPYLLPSNVQGGDDGKMMQVVDGSWKLVDAPSGNTIRYDASQELNVIQQNTARNNIAAGRPPLVIEITENEDGTFSASKTSLAVYTDKTTYGEREVYCTFRGLVLRPMKSLTIVSAKFFGFDGNNCVIVTLPMSPTSTRATVEEWSIEDKIGGDIKAALGSVMVELTLNEDGVTFTADKSAAECLAAYESGNPVYIYYHEEATKDYFYGTLVEALIDDGDPVAVYNMWNADGTRFMPVVHLGQEAWDSGGSTLATEQYVQTVVGDISAALDELHTYAQALVNGGDAE